MADSAAENTPARKKMQTVVIAKEIEAEYDEQANAIYTGGETFTVLPELLHATYILVWVTVIGVATVLTRIFVPDSIRDDNTILNRYGYNAPCFNIDYFPSRQFINMTLMLYEVLYISYLLMSWIQTRQVAANPLVLSIGEKWVKGRAFLACLKLAFLMLGARMCMTWNPDENITLHVTGFLFIQLNFFMNEMEVFIYHYKLL